MKKFLIALVLGLFLITDAFSATTCPQTTEPLDGGNKVIVTFICTGDADGAVSDTKMSSSTLNDVHGLYFHEIEAFPTSGGTAPDEASVFVFDENNIYLLGSEDGGTTAYEGLYLIHATLARTALPNKYLPRAGQHAWGSLMVKNKLTLKVADQGTNGGDYTIIMTFVK